MRDFDTNKDGALQLSELPSSLGLQAADERHMQDISIIRALFTDLDSDSDGQLNLLELPALVDALNGVAEQRRRDQQ